MSGREHARQGEHKMQRLRGGDLLGVSEDQQGGQDTWSRAAKERAPIAKIREVG